MARYLDGMPVRATVDRYLRERGPGRGGGSDSCRGCRTRRCVGFILHSCAVFVQPGGIEIEMKAVHKEKSSTYFKGDFKGENLSLRYNNGQFANGYVHSVCYYFM